MKILFLDIDGVLNNDGSNERFGTNRRFDPKNVNNLNRILAQTECSIVVSSNWREGNPFWMVQSVLYQQGIQGPIIDGTPDLKRLNGWKEDRHQLRIRGIEIQQWLDEHLVVRHAIVDDRHVPGHDNFFRTDPKVGLTNEMSNRIIAHLNGIVIESEGIVDDPQASPAP